MLTFNIQVLAMDIKKELFHPTYRRIRKVARLSLFYETLGGLLLGITGYLSLGDKFIPHLLLLRKPIQGHFAIEVVMKTLLVIFFFCVVLGIPAFNVPLRRFIIQMTNKKFIDRKTYVLISTIPLLTIFTISIIFPYIIQVLNIFGLTVYNINAYLIPFLLKYQMHKKEKNHFKAIMFVFLFLLFALLSTVGTYYNISRWFV